ncbi:unnamed protein product, partial [Trichogramma brassicae]
MRTRIRLANTWHSTTDNFVLMEHLEQYRWFFKNAKSVKSVSRMNAIKLNIILLNKPIRRLALVPLMSSRLGNASPNHFRLLSAAASHTLSRWRGVSSSAPHHLHVLSDTRPILWPWYLRCPWPPGQGTRSISKLEDDLLHEITVFPRKYYRRMAARSIRLLSGIDDEFLQEAAILTRKYHPAEPIEVRLSRILSLGYEMLSERVIQTLTLVALTFTIFGIGLSLLTRRPHEMRCTCAIQPSFRLQPAKEYRRQPMTSPGTRHRRQPTTPSSHRTQTYGPSSTSRNLLRVQWTIRRLMPYLRGDDNEEVREIAINRRDAFGGDTQIIDDNTRVCTNCYQSIREEVRLLQISSLDIHAERRCSISSKYAASINTDQLCPNSSRMRRFAAKKCSQ